ncbi:dihydroxyacetone kinase subunit DhaL [Lactobacillus jensenii]|jgi:dihydroxyacetone kinase, L subunit|uniref:Dihydroxyacetone kinase subunit DhaL n=1 Tax=Lactobacillus jensenii TaxID=109790 RepID=A0ABU9FJS4_LACJE|nr:dihydroxyacetone kinase subunit DhaL [Lactobacillus jensenii]EEQ69069.1 dihydroxyacetone kinase, L subunit [Lactobacillus jensenii 1153]APT14840.1 dihydroxyacetone kinase subunit L [Lactobacillus jensenii]EEQ24514.1 dihydroxyacetone kinase, L subunit [Lactobacillus jensenii 269-3]EEX27553.1 dihydroxyacetone kinase, L subunit [Lactobacillus jensenii SJ-7A-US]KAA9234580.1 dihydroxyacetone kinase subunit L [Lactobacillus jensenii]
MQLTLDVYEKWLRLFAKKVESNKLYLSELDAAIGDGDHGNNMARGVSAVEEGFNLKTPQDLTSALKLTAMAFISKVGGASGPLYGTAFLEMAKASSKTDDLSELLEAALAGIKKRGGATAGDKTMVDVWEKVLPTIKDGSISEDGIEEAVEATKDMQAKKGRASYLGERSIGHLDPGAVSSGYLFNSLLKAEE